MPTILAHRTAHLEPYGSSTLARKGTNKNTNKQQMNINISRNALLIIAGLIDLSILIGIVVLVVNALTK